MEMTTEQLWEVLDSIEESARKMAHYLHELDDHGMGRPLSPHDAMTVAEGRVAETKLLAAVEKLRNGPWSGGARIFYE